MENGYKKLSQAPKHHTSPFHQGTMSSLKLKKFPIFPRGPMVNTTTGEVVTDNVYLHKKYAYKDEDTPVKVYQQMGEILSKMSGPTIKLFFFILSHINNGSEYVYISSQLAADWLGYKSSKDIYRALVELVNRNIIARSNELNMYYINPNVIFMGNKMQLLKDEKDTE